MKWRPRVKEVEAVLFNGSNLENIKKFLGSPWEVTLDEPKYGRYLIWCINGYGELDMLAFLFKNQFVIKHDGEILVEDKEDFLSEYERVQ